jgi:hypothetical protein
MIWKEAIVTSQNYISSSFFEGRMKKKTNEKLVGIANKLKI